uniref:LPD25 domain-containing protein n=1 Tax=Bacillus sp. DX2.2 TaxID=3073452 RepID=UPI00402AF316
MSKKRSPVSFEEKKQKVEALTKKMEKSIEGYFRSPGDLKEYLSFMAKFYRYSPSNIALIQSQFEGSRAVGSFSFWKEKGFTVQKGEKGIQILVPNQTTAKFKDKIGTWKPVAKASEEEKKQIESKKVEVKPGRLYFSVGYVFDVVQTNAKAEDLPRIFPNRWLEGNVGDYKSLYKGMEAIAEKNGVNIIEPKQELGVAKGVSYTLTKEVALNPRNSELQNVKTLLHELAHAKLHTAETHMNYTAPEKEFQAEMTAYTVSSYFGIDTSEYSLEYLANWTQGKELKDKSKLLKEVHETSTEFIETIENTLKKEKEQIHGKEVDGMVKTEPNINGKREEKNIFLMKYGAIGHTEQEIVSVSELREKVSRDTSFNVVENAEELSDKEFLKSFNESNEERFIALNQDEINCPMMIVQWSESAEFKSNQMIPFGEANEKMKDYIRGIELAKEEAKLKGEYVPYEKTRYHVVIPREVDTDFQRMEIITPDRLDLGDGDYKSPYEQILNEKRSLSDEVKQALRDDVIEHTPMKPAEEKMISMFRDGEYEHISIRELKEREAREAGLVYEADGSEIEPAYKTPLVTIEILRYPEDETVGIVHMMDAVSKDIHHVPVLQPDSSNRDLFVPLMRENGERDKFPLDMVLREKLYKNVQNSIFDRGNQSFVVHQNDANMKLHEIVRTERYGTLVDKKKEQENPTFSEKEVEFYKEVKKEGYAPIDSLEQKLQPLPHTAKHVTDSMEKELSGKYEAFKRAQSHETVNDIDSIIHRVQVEERYFATKHVAIDNDLITQESVTQLEHKVQEKLNKEGVTATKQTASKVVDGEKQFEPFSNFKQFQNVAKKKKQEVELER